MTPASPVPPPRTKTSFVSTLICIAIISIIACISIPKGCSELSRRASRGDLWAARLLGNPGDNGYHPMLDAARGGHLEVVKYFVEHGADVNMMDFMGARKALYNAASGGHLPVVAYLWSKKATLHRGGENLTGSEGPRFYTTDPVSAAAGGGHLEVVQFFLDRVPPDQIPGGWAGLVNAAAVGDQPEMLRFLVTRGADINAADSHGRTPLHWAIVTKHRGVVLTLLELGAKNDIAVSNGQTALAMAEETGDTELIGLLESSSEKKNGGAGKLVRQ